MRITSLFVTIAYVTSAPIMRAKEPTPEGWKEISEKKKNEYLLHNYGVPMPHPSDDLVPVRLLEPSWASEPSLVASRDFSPIRRAAEKTDEQWKELSEAKKFAYLSRNYGVKLPS